MLQRVLLLLVFICASIAHGRSQSYTNVYYMNESFASVKKADAVYVCKGYQDSIGFKLDCFTVGTNALALSCYFTDKTLATLQGNYEQYFADHRLQTKGSYHNSERQGVWEEWNEKGFKTDSAFFENGQRLRYVHYQYYENAEKKRTVLSSLESKDSLADTYDKLYFSDSGTITGNAHFKGNRGVFEKFIDGKTTRDSVFSREEKEAAYPGGNHAWSSHIQKMISGFDPAMNGAPDGKWQVIVNFIVNIDGNIIDIKAETNFGYKMEEVSIAAIKKSSKWAPAIQFGVPVKAYRRQPFTYLVETH